jgi:hypothetical protein
MAKHTTLPTIDINDLHTITGGVDGKLLPPWPTQNPPTIDHRFDQMAREIAVRQRVADPKAPDR